MVKGESVNLKTCKKEHAIQEDEERLNWGCSLQEEAVPSETLG